MSAAETEDDPDRSDRDAVRKIFQAAGYAPESLPEHRRAWFAEFVARSHRLAAAPAQKQDRTDRLQLWEWFINAMLDRGVVVELLSQCSMAFDPDGKDVRRGWPYAAKAKLAMLAVDDARAIVTDAIAAPVAKWLTYPAWFGKCTPAEATRHCNRWRARAVKFFPEFARQHPSLAPEEVDLMHGLLDDPEAQVRWCAAMSIAERNPGPADEKTVARLIEAVADRHWVWSDGDYYNDFSTGAHAAASVLARLGARAALPAIAALLEDEERVRQELLSAQALDANPWVESRLKRLREAVQRSR
jgi:hypothetical protein